MTAFWIITIGGAIILVVVLNLALCRITAKANTYRTHPGKEWEK